LVRPGGPPPGAARAGPQPPPLPLFLGHLQPLLPPQPVDALDVHPPAATPQQGGDPPVAVARVLAGQGAQLLDQFRPPGRVPRPGGTPPSGGGPGPRSPGAGSRPAAAARAGRPAASGPGSEVSLGGLLEDLVVEGQLGDDPLQPLVLLLQLPEAADLVGL